MKKILSLFVLLLSCTICLYGQNRRNGDEEKRPSFEQFLAHKTSFMVREMQLNEADSVRFVGVYMQLQKEKGELMRKYHTGHEVFQKIKAGTEWPDSLYLRIVFNDAQLQMEDTQLERQYLDKFSKILTPKQLFMYMMADRKFKNSFMQRRPNHNKRNN